MTKNDPALDRVGLKIQQLRHELHGGMLQELNALAFPNGREAAAQELEDKIAGFRVHPVQRRIIESDARYTCAAQFRR